MSDNTSNRGPADRSRINVNEDYELRYWSEKFGCSADELKQAVKTAGVSAEAVEKHLVPAAVKDAVWARVML